MSRKQLECRVVIFRRPDRKIDLGMYDPITSRYEALGTHGPTQGAIDAAVRGLVQRIDREGHLITFCDRAAG